MTAALLGLFAGVGHAQEWIGFADNTTASLSDRGSTRANTAGGVPTPDPIAAP